MTMKEVKKIVVSLPKETALRDNRLIRNMVNKYAKELSGRQNEFFMGLMEEKGYLIIDKKRIPDFLFISKKHYNELIERIQTIRAEGIKEGIKLQKEKTKIVRCPHCHKKYRGESKALKKHIDKCYMNPERNCPKCNNVGFYTIDRAEWDKYDGKSVVIPTRRISVNCESCRIAWQRGGKSYYNSFDIAEKGIDLNKEV